MANRFYVVQDTFSSGFPGPGFTCHESREDAEREAKERNAVLILGSTCVHCGSVLGADHRPLQDGCNFCR